MRKLLPLLLCFTLLSSTVVAFQSPGNHYSVAPPAGWNELPADQLAMLEAAFGKQSGNAPKFDAAWKLASSPVPRPPLVMVSFVPQTVDFDQVPEYLAKKEAQTPAKFPMRPAQFDNARHRVSREFSLPASASGPMKGVLYMFVGKAGIVNMQCFAPDDFTYGTNAAAFNAFADAVKFDAGYEYDTSAARRHRGGGVVLLLLIAAGVAVYFLFIKKKKPAA